MTVLLETKNLTVRIADHLVCHSLTWQVKAGEIWGVLGCNGRGKTTLLQTLCRLHPSAQGDIFLQGTPLSHFSAKKMAQHIGFLFQEMDLAFSPTVFDYCLAGRYPHLSRLQRESAHDREITQQALNHMHLHAHANQMANTLSGGEKQRLALATLLTQNPRLFLLDEPLNHLDWHYQAKVIALLRSLARDHSAGIVVSLHDLNWIERLCDKVILLFDKGEIRHGETSMLLTEDNLSRLFGHSVRNIHTPEGRYWLPEPF